MQNFICYYKWRCVHGCLFIKLLFLPVYSSEAGGEFGSSGFMMCDAGAATPVPRTAFFCAWAINIIMWTGHGTCVLLSHYSFYVFPVEVYSD